MSELNLDELRESIISIDIPREPEGWLAVAARPFNDGTVKQVSLWAAFAIMATTSLISLAKVPWGQKTKRRFHVLPFFATLLSAIFHLLMALGYNGERTCKNYHLASDPHSDGPDDWQPGTVEGLMGLEVCRGIIIGLDRWDWRFILGLWMGQCVTHATGSLGTGSSAFGIITALDIYGPSDSELWNLFVRSWIFATGTFFVARSTYQMATHTDARARNFFFSLEAYAAALVFFWAKGRVFHSDLEDIAYAITNALINSGISLWLLNTDVPNVGAERDRAMANGDRVESGFSLGEAVLVVRMAQLAAWQHGQGYK